MNTPNNSEALPPTTGSAVITPGDALTMIHQTQPTGWSCVHTCLAIIMGVEAEEVIRRTKQSGLSRMDTITAMQRFGMIFAPLVGSSLWDGWHLAVVPSLNHEGGNHSVLIYHNDEGDFRVVDPATGKRYEESGRNLMAWSETILVKPSGSLDYWDRHLPNGEAVSPLGCRRE